jgi:hypothetical protein
MWQPRSRLTLAQAALAATTAFTVLSFTPEALAFCRTHTCEFSNDISCPEDDLTGCFTGGVPVFWAESCFGFAVQRDGSVAEDISAEELEAIVDEGFRIWSAVDCGGGATPPISASSQGLIACGDVEYNCEEPDANSNVIAFRDDFVDTVNFRLGTIALTTLTANLRRGEIFDADIEINSRDEDFSIGQGGELERDLRGVVHHELGHLLGLGHSIERSALMFPAYEGRIDPAADDITAICSVLRGAAGDVECSAPALDPDAECLGSNIACQSPVTVADSGGGCGCRLGPSGEAAAARPPALPWLVLLGLLGLSRRGRRAQRVL